MEKSIKDFNFTGMMGNVRGNFPKIAELFRSIYPYQ